MTGLGEVWILSLGEPKLLHLKDVPNTTLFERFEASSYILNKDFSIKAYDKFDLKVGVSDYFLIEAIVTWYHGICYKIGQKFKITEASYVSFIFHLNESNTDQPNDVMMYLTSPDATLNLATG